QPILQSTGNIEGYSITNQFGVVSVSRIITLTSNDGRHETDEAVDAALHELSAKADSLTANAVVNICIGYTGIESMTLAPRVLLTVSGTAVTVKPQTVVATGIPVPETTDTTVPATSS
ncbi:MAG: heavy metal-binding domain-containing protein, partial [Oxalobacter sp.]|nr:heavy metal-binding domain-containing protein [Oxalobacter sp.]